MANGITYDVPIKKIIMAKSFINSFLFAAYIAIPQIETIINIMSKTKTKMKRVLCRFEA